MWSQLMPNITIHLDEETHRLAKIYAAQSGVSLSKSFRDHVLTLSGDDASRGGAAIAVMERAVIKRYASGELTANEAMTALGFTCLEELFNGVLQAGLHLPHLSKTAALQLAKPLIAGGRAGSHARARTRARNRAAAHA
jgi:hypothetical protein